MILAQDAVSAQDVARIQRCLPCHLGVVHFRHRDHRFEWTRQEFQAWAARIAERFDYTVRFLPIGPEDAGVGAPTQMGVFSRKDGEL